MNLTITGSSEIFDLEVLIVVQSINVNPPKQPFWKRGKKDTSVLWDSAKKYISGELTFKEDVTLFTQEKQDIFITNVSPLTGELKTTKIFGALLTPVKGNNKTLNFTADSIVGWKQ